MKRLWLAALGGVAVLSVPGCARSGETEAPATVVVVTPAKEALGSAEQQLLLRGVKAPDDAAGVEVFLNPGDKETLSPASKSYLGSVYFGHRRAGQENIQDFAISLHKPVSGPARVVLYLITAKGTHGSKRTELKEAAIQAADNSAFK